MKKIVIFIATIFLLSISVFAAPTVSVNKYLNNKNLMIKKVPTAIKLSKAEDPAGLGNVYVFNKDGGMSLFLRYNGNKVTVLQNDCEKNLVLYGVKLSQRKKTADKALKKRSWKYTRKEKGGGGCWLEYKKGTARIRLLINGGRVNCYQWQRG